MKSMNFGIWLMLSGLGIIWGGAFVFNGLALRAFGPITVVCSRLLIGALILNLILLISGRRYPKSWKTAGELLLLGLVNNAIPFNLIVWAQTRINAGTASIINAASPLFAIVLAHFLTRDEKMIPSRILGVLIGISGVVVLFGPEALKGVGGDPLPRLAVLGAALCYSLAGIFSKRFGEKGMDSLTISAGQLTGSSLITLPLALFFEKPWNLPAPGAAPILAILGLGVLSSALAYIIYFRILDRAGAGNALLVTMIVPFFALFLGSLLLSEAIRLQELLALGILITGLLVIDGRIFRRFRRGDRRDGAGAADG